MGPNATNVWQQGWKLTERIELDEAWIDSWQLYLNELKIIHVRTRDAEDSSGWAKTSHRNVYC